MEEIKLEPFVQTQELMKTDQPTPRRRVLQTLNVYFQQLSQDYHMLAVLLYGSQNYHLETSFSDIDAYAIILPDAVDMTFTTPGHIHSVQSTKRTISFPTGQVTIKTLPEYMQMLLKQGFSALETLYSPYQIIHPDYQSYWDEFLDKRDHIANLDVYRQLQIAHNMLQARCNDFIKAYKTDPKTVTGKPLARACHLYAFLTARQRGIPFYQALDMDGTKNQPIIMELKTAKDATDDTEIITAVQTFQTRENARWEHYSQTHHPLDNHDPHIQQLQTELANIILPIWICHVHTLLNESTPHIEYL